MDTAVTGTAIGPMVIAAVDQYEEHPLVRDHLAARMLPTAGRVAVAVARWRPVRRALFAATEKKIAGLWASMLCRKRYIDELVDTSDAEAVVVLGAGFDTRGARFGHRQIFEVDLPSNVESKRTRLRAVFGEVPPNVRLVPVDFETQDLATALAEHGYRAGLRTLFIWEAVTQYLTEDAVRATFGVLAGAPADSELVFTFIRKDFIEGTALFGGAAAHHEFVVERRLWKFGLLPDEVPGFVQPYGWAEVEQLGPHEFTARYLEPAGRLLPVSEIELTSRCVKVAP